MLYILGVGSRGGREDRKLFPVEDCTKKLSSYVGFSCLGSWDEWCYKLLIGCVRINFFFPQFFYKACSGWTLGCFPLEINLKVVWHEGVSMEKC